jgi:hypothetical protein
MRVLVSLYQLDLALLLSFVLSPFRTTAMVNRSSGRAIGTPGRGALVLVGAFRILRSVVFTKAALDQVPT